MEILMLLGVVLTLQWGPPCGGNLMQGTPVPATEPKAQVRISFVKTVPTTVCTTTVDLGPGSYVLALWFGQHPVTSVMQESNRVGVIVKPDGTWTTDSPYVPTTPPIPTNLRIP